MILLRLFIEKRFNKLLSVIPRDDLIALVHWETLEQTAEWYILRWSYCACSLRNAWTNCRVIYLEMILLRLFTEKCSSCSDGWVTKDRALRKNRIHSYCQSNTRQHDLTIILLPSQHERVTLVFRWNELLCNCIHPVQKKEVHTTVKQWVPSVCIILQIT